MFSVRRLFQATIWTGIGQKFHQLRSVSSEDDRPEDGREEEEEGEREEDGGKGDLAGRQEVVAVLLDDVDGEVGGGEDVAVVRVVAVVVEQRVQSFLLYRDQGLCLI